ncbi:hypothetical protein HDF26_001705 [Pedobacter cryoconitis]|uniref:Uncharacterized protein n=1 Tax=Pedobacter cryoconitis TaxID=188932 RepID=A0A7W9E037_9SPHI|nr:hypothetical protein [Pedobacter cryoconitis]MBB5636879.1 hypothetical protein [Pedobacter cryoconitis]MBB6271278.1 hypothetical protein [Pedobacter cryoconitis]
MFKLEKYRIPLERAVAYTAKWREIQSLNPKDPGTKVRAFNIDIAELQEIIHEIGVEKIRLYIGINDKNKETLVLVGVNKDNEDMISVPGEDENTEESGIFDFTHPCPDTCADGLSPLNAD